MAGKENGAPGTIRTSDPQIRRLAKGAFNFNDLCLTYCNNQGQATHQVSWVTAGTCCAQKRLKLIIEEPWHSHFTAANPAVRLITLVVAGRARDPFIIASEHIDVIRESAFHLAFAATLRIIVACELPFAVTKKALYRLVLTKVGLIGEVPSLLGA